MENNGVNNDVIQKQTSDLPKEIISTPTIFDKIKEQVGKAKVYGFGIGVVIYPEDGEKINIEKVRSFWKPFVRFYMKKGLTEEEIGDGIIEISEYKSTNPNLENPKSCKGLIRKLYVTRNGRVIEEVNGDERFESKLTPRHIDALKRIQLLSGIPRQIKETFGSYEKFKKALGKKDMAGIEYADFGGKNVTNFRSGDKITYEDGLGKFVKALELQKKGKLSKLVSSPLKSSLIIDDTTFRVLEALEKA